MNNKRYQTSIRRIYAAFIDGLVLSPFSFIAHFVYKQTNNQMALFASYAIDCMIPVVYSILFHYKYGYTVGKLLAGVKVLDLTENTTLTFKQSVYRDSVHLIIALGYIIFSAGFLLYASDKTALAKLSSSAFGVPIMWWTIIEIITMLTNKKRRALHDFLAGSVVVNVDN